MPDGARPSGHGLALCTLRSLFGVGPLHRGAKGPRGYRFVDVADDEWFQIAYGGVGPAEGTVLVQVRQRAFDGLTPEGQRNVISALVGIGLRVSRVDVWEDEPLEGATRPSAYEVALESGAVRRHVRTWELHRGRRNGQAGETLEIGGRQSAIFERKYVKDRARLRHEVEVKGDACPEVVARLLGGAPPGVLRRALSERLVEWSQWRHSGHARSPKAP